MSYYLTAAQARALAGPNAELPDREDDLEALIAEAEGDVDIVLGGPRVFDGHAVDLSLVTDAQRAALALATARACAHRASMDPDELVGGASFGAPGLPVMWRGQLPPGPGVVHALAGHRLIRRRLMALDGDDR